jgi:hypothetical protein
MGSRKIEINCKARNTRNIKKAKGQEEFVLHTAILTQAWRGPLGLQKITVPRFPDNWRVKVVRSSAIRIGRLYPPGCIPDTHITF